MSEIQSELSHIRNRRDMIRFFDGYSIDRMAEAEERLFKRPLIKTQLLELLDCDTQVSVERLKALLPNNAKLSSVDENLYRITDLQFGDIGFLDLLTPRVIALYTPIRSDLFVQWVRRFVYANPTVDYVWLSGRTFEVLWNLVVKLSKPHRYTKLVFTHDSIFDIDTPTPMSEDDDDVVNSSEPQEDAEQILERRATSFRLVDRVGVISEKLIQLQRVYSPLHAISQLRFPSPIGSGGHDFYDNGRVTNRSGSFRDHRSHILFVVGIYERLLRLTEEQTWYSIQESISVPGQFRKIVGSPVVVRFPKPGLDKTVFKTWITSTFQRKRNRFRLWGHPISLGDQKVHVYGVDRHLWQPIFLELTTNGLTTLIPNGTCGNTVHRLVTNIQRYLEPAAEAFIGDRSYQEMVEESSRSQQYEPNAE